MGREPPPCAIDGQDDIVYEQQTSPDRAWHTTVDSIEVVAGINLGDAPLTATLAPAAGVDVSDCGHLSSDREPTLLQ